MRCPTNLLPLVPAFVGAFFSAAPVSAQAAAYRITGASCTTGRLTNSIGPVPLSVVGLPRLGASFTIVTEGSANYPWGNRRRVALMTGISNTSAGGVRLPLDISGWGSRYCGLLRTSIEAMSPVPRVLDYRSTAGITFTVPNMPSLAGVKFYQQILSQEFSSFGPPFSACALSAGGEGTVGF